MFYGAPYPVETAKVILSCTSQFSEGGPQILVQKATTWEKLALKPHKHSNTTVKPETLKSLNHDPAS